MHRGTLQSPLGVLVMAQAAKWHRDPNLTANVCTDPKLLDLAGAVASLPDLPLVAGSPGPRRGCNAPPSSHAPIFTGFE
jgi:hypothetical protein